MRFETLVKCHNISRKHNVPGVMEYIFVITMTCAIKTKVNGITRCVKRGTD